jgi:hypothetical protein
MTIRSYQLINPLIDGTFVNVFDATTPIIAAKTMWTNLSEHFIPNYTVPKFMFTMRDIASMALYHFEVVENYDGTFTVGELAVKIDPSHFDNFINCVHSYNRNCDKHQFGGKPNRKRYDDSSSSSSSSSSSTSSSSAPSLDIYPSLVRTSPISMFHYNYRFYAINGNGKSTINPQLVSYDVPIFQPVFKPVLQTVVSLW